MIASIIRAFTVWSLAVLAAGMALGAERPDVERQGRDLLAKKLAEFKGAERGQIIPLTAEPVGRAFPEHLFYMLRFRQYPVALVPPEPLGANNLFVVKPEASVGHIQDAGALETFFRSTLAPVQTETQAKVAAKAWLRLVQEFHQDGFFRFSIPDDSVRVTWAQQGGLRVTGKALVDPRGGNTGEIVGSLTFDRAGKLVRASETANVRAGIRPECQATNLLDPDPIVRGMAEQAILIMGKGTKGYLDEQRARAGPALQRAIDRIWRRILAEDR